MTGRAVMLALVLTTGITAPLGLPYVGTDDSAHPVTAPSKPAKVEDANDRARRLGRQAARHRGYTTRQWKCMDELAQRESHWRPNARTGSHYGVFQHRNLKPGSPLSKQLATFFRYIDHRYDGDPCKALHHSHRTGWY